jgi:AraC family transcriptional regulator of adaptative response/methylated-DNA-[protein]-cysteine methyltransferase
MNATTENALLPACATELDPRWAFLVNRDAAADGSFYFSVRTTGVYCRPSCPSRRARPENVRFHLTRADAENAGFRPCQRCRPDQLPLVQSHSAMVADACRIIEQADTAPRLEELAGRMGLSKHHFHRIFKQVTGLTPYQYARAQRSKRVQAGLTRSDTVTEAIYEAGYGTSSCFYEEANGVLGMTPVDYRQGGTDTRILFAIGQCSLGSILVAQSQRGICAILLGDEPELLLHDLQDRFPKADLIGGDEQFEQLVARVVGFVEAPALGLDLPLDIRGTAFQQRVWQALRQIPAGETASYAGVARSIGAPTSARAVAQACGANAIAVAIPCHRVVRNDGGLSGYRWGVERKRELLDRERKF